MAEQDKYDIIADVSLRIANEKAFASEIDTLIKKAAKDAVSKGIKEGIKQLSNINVPKLGDAAKGIKEIANAIRTFNRVTANISFSKKQIDKIEESLRRLAKLAASSQDFESMGNSLQILATGVSKLNKVANIKFTLVDKIAGGDISKIESLADAFAKLYPVLQKLNTSLAHFVSQKQTQRGVKFIIKPLQALASSLRALSTVPISDEKFNKIFNAVNVQNVTDFVKKIRTLGSNLKTLAKILRVANKELSQFTSLFGTASRMADKFATTAISGLNQTKKTLKDIVNAGGNNILKIFETSVKDQESRLVNIRKSVEKTFSSVAQSALDTLLPLSDKRNVLGRPNRILRSVSAEINNIKKQFGAMLSESDLAKVDTLNSKFVELAESINRLLALRQRRKGFVVPEDVKQRLKIPDKVTDKIIFEEEKKLRKIQKQIDNVFKHIATKVSKEGIKPLLKSLGIPDAVIQSYEILSNKSSSALAKVGASITLTGKLVGSLADKLIDFAEKGFLAFKRFVAFTVATTPFFKVINTITEAIKQSFEFERALVRLAQIANKTTREIKGLGDALVEASIKFGVESEKVTKFAQILLQAGFSLADVKRAVPRLAQALLTPTFGTEEAISEATIAIARQFNLSLDEAFNKLDALNEVAKNFSVESKDLVAVVRRAGGMFSQLGGSVEELIALFTSVRATTRETAETISTGLRTIFARLQRPRTVRILRQLGVELRDLEGNFIGPFQAVLKLNEALSALDPRTEIFANLVEELGGIRQVAKIIPILTRVEVAQRALAVAQKAQGSIARDAAKAQESVLVKLRKLYEEIFNAIRKITETKLFKILVGTFIGIVKIVAKLVKQLGNMDSSFVGTALTITAVLAGLTKMSGLFILISNNVFQLKEQIREIARLNQIITNEQQKQTQEQQKRTSLNKVDLQIIEAMRNEELRRAQAAQIQTVGNVIKGTSIGVGTLSGLGFIASGVSSLFGSESISSGISEAAAKLGLLSGAAALLSSVYNSLTKAIIANESALGRLTTAYATSALKFVAAGTIAFTLANVIGDIIIGFNDYQGSLTTAIQNIGTTFQSTESAIEAANAQIRANRTQAFGSGGAAIGAVVGTFLGGNTLIGGIIGGILGGIVGYITANEQDIFTGTDDAIREIRNKLVTNISDGITSLSKRIENEIRKSKLVDTVVVSQLVQHVNTLNEIVEKTEDELQIIELVKKRGESLQKIQSLVGFAARRTRSRKQLDLLLGGKLDEIIATFEAAGQSFKKSIENMIDNTIELNRKSDLLAKRLTEQVLAVSKSVKAIEELNNSFINVSNTIDNSIKSIKSLSEIVSGNAVFANIETRISEALQNLLSGQPIPTNFLAQIEAQIKEMFPGEEKVLLLFRQESRIRDVLPRIIRDIGLEVQRLTSGGLIQNVNMIGERLFEQELRKAGIGQEFTRILTDIFAKKFTTPTAGRRAGLEGVKSEFIKNPRKIAEDLFGESEAVITSALKNTIQVFETNINKMSVALSELHKTFEKRNKIIESIFDKEQKIFEFRLSQARTIQERNAIREQQARRLNAIIPTLLSTAGINNLPVTPQAIGTALQQVNARRQAILTQINTGGLNTEQIRIFNLELASLNMKASVLSRSLELLSDQSKKLAILQGKLSDIQRNRERQAKRVEQFILNPETFRQTKRDFDILRTVLRRRTGPTKFELDAIKRLLSMFEDNEKVLGNLTRRNIIEIIGRRQGFPERLLRTLRPSQEERNIQRQILGVLNQQLNAEQQRLQIVQNIQAQQLQELQKISKILIGLGQIFVLSSEKAKRESELQDLQRQFNNIQKFITANTRLRVNLAVADKKNILKSLGIDIDSKDLPERLTELKQKFPLIQRFDLIRQALPRVSKVAKETTGRIKSIETAEKFEVIQKNLKNIKDKRELARQVFAAVGVPVQLAESLNEKQLLQLQKSINKVGTVEFTTILSTIFNDLQTKLNDELKSLEKEDIIKRFKESGFNAGALLSLIQTISQMSEDIRVASDIALRNIPSKELSFQALQLRNRIANLSRELSFINNNLQIRTGQQQPIKRQHGGLVTGPRGVDRIAARLTAGEFVIKRSAVRSLGVETLRSINQGKLPVISADNILSVEGGDKILEAAKMLNDSFQTLSNIINLLGSSFNSIANSANKFIDAANMIKEAAELMPSKIVMDAKHTVEVIVNGAEVLTRIQPAVEELVVQKTNEALEQFRRQLADGRRPGIIRA